MHVNAEYEIAGRKGIHAPVPDLYRSLRKGKGSQSEIEASINADVTVHFLNEQGKQRDRTLAFAPALSVALEPGTQVSPVGSGTATAVKVGLSCNLTGAPPGTLRLELPAGWRAEPVQLQVNLPRRGDKQDFEFKVFPAGLEEGRPDICAGLASGGGRDTEGYPFRARECLGRFYYLQ